MTCRTHTYCVCSQTEGIYISYFLSLQSNRRNSTIINPVCADKQLTYRSHTFCVCSQTDDIPLSYLLWLQSNRWGSALIQIVCAVKQMKNYSHTFCVCSQTDDKPLNYILCVQTSRWYTALIHSVCAVKLFTYHSHITLRAVKQMIYLSHKFCVCRLTDDIPISFILCVQSNRWHTALIHYVCAVKQVT